jgi:acetaldehyde dehydrogenase
MTDTVTVAIVGSGNIGTDLLIKLRRDDLLDVRWMIGVDPESDGLRRAGAAGLQTSADGVDWLLAQDDLPGLLFEATAAGVHAANAPRYAEAGITAIDLTPAAVGPLVIPSVNLDEHLHAQNLNMVTCGGQATVPIVAAVSRVTSVPYAEIVASVSSVSAGPGTRANIDEFTHTTAEAVRVVGGAERGKAIIILNPAKPPMLMRDTVYCAIAEDADEAAISDSVHEMVADVARFVPGYRLTAAPQFDAPRDGWGGLGRVTILLEVEGRGDSFPPYAGNLDIMTAAAARVGHQLALARTEVAA